MRKSRFTEEKIVGCIWQAEAGMLIKGLCRKGASATRRSRGYVEQFHLSERRACRLAGLARDSYRAPRQESQMNRALSAKIIESVLVSLRLGYRRIHDLLRPQCEDVNHKRMLRLPEMTSSYGVEDDVLKQCLKSIERKATQLRSLTAEVLHEYPT